MLGREFIVLWLGREKKRSKWGYSQGSNFIVVVGLAVRKTVS